MADNKQGVEPRQREPHNLLGKKFAKTSRLMVSGKVWMGTIPTRNCDILMTFPAKTDDNTLMWLLSLLRSRTPQITVHVRHHSKSGIYGFYMTAAYEHLLAMAETLAMRKHLKNEFGGGIKEFTIEDQNCFADIDDDALFFTSQERQCIVYHMLCNLRAKSGEQLGKVTFLEEQAIVPILQSKGVISQVFPLHNNDDLAVLRKSWVQAVFRSQPINKICDYFGVKIGMYFAYLGHYTTALIMPAVIGLAFWLIQGKSEMADDICFLSFAVINVVWATLYLEDWKRKNAELAYHWGTLDKESELIEDPRPLYTGDLRQSPVTGRLEPHYAAWKRNLFRYFVTCPVIILCLCVVFVVMLLIFELQEWLNLLIKQEDIPSAVKFLPKVLLALSIGILDDIYKKIAFWLNDKENYRKEETYENHLIIKLVLFQFVNSFLSLFYIAFYLRDMNRLREQLAALLITRQVIGNIKEAILPYVVWKLKLFKVGYKMMEGMSPGYLQEEAKGIIDKAIHSEDKNKNVQKEESRKKFKEDKEHASDDEDNSNGFQLTQAESESTMKPYEDTFEDYLEMCIQFGYVTLFSSAFPMAAVCALLNNIIEIRSDAFKLSVTLQRPFGKRVENIGTWQDALEVLSIIAVIVNCALIGLSGQVERMSPGMTAAGVILLIVIIEHIILALKATIAYAIPDIPHWVATEMARLEFMRRTALKKLESQAATGNSQNSPDFRAAPSRQASGNSTVEAQRPSTGQQTYISTYTVVSTNPVKPASQTNEFPKSSTSSTIKSVDGTFSSSPVTTSTSIMSVSNPSGYIPARSQAGFSESKVEKNAVAGGMSCSNVVHRKPTAL